MKKRNRISFAALTALTISLLAFALYALLLDGINVYIPWIILGVVAPVFPILSKCYRTKRGLQGKTIEIIALIIGAFDFYCVFFVTTTLNIYISYALIAIVCVVYAKICNNASTINTVDAEYEEEPPSDEYKTNKAIKKRYCKYCGGEIDGESRKCTKCGKQYFRFRIKWRAVIAAMLIIGLVALNVYQYVQCQVNMAQLQKQINEQTLTISTQAETIETQKREIADKAKTIRAQLLQIFDMEDRAKNYDEIYNNLKSSNIGYASNNFKVDRSVVILGLLENDEEITLTAHWSGGGTVTIEHSSGCAELIFNDNSWNTSTMLSVVPHAEGVTVATFSNDVNSQTFKVLIIVSGIY